MNSLKKILVIGKNERSAKHIYALKKIKGIFVEQIGYMDFKLNEELKRGYDYFLVCVRWDKNYEVVSNLLQNNRGKIILSEKPMTGIIKNLNDNKLCLLYDRRHYDSVNFAKKYIKYNQKNTVFVNFSDDIIEKRNRFKFLNEKDYLHIYFVHIIDFIIYIFGEIDSFKSISSSVYLDSYLLKAHNNHIVLNIFKGGAKFTDISILNHKSDLFLFQGFESLKFRLGSGKFKKLPLESRGKVLERMWVGILSGNSFVKYTSTREEKNINKVINFLKKN
jgi:hypothetical protein